jgi:hypothetical protein
MPSAAALAFVRAAATASISSTVVGRPSLASTYASEPLPPPKSTARASGRAARRRSIASSACAYSQMRPVSPRTAEPAARTRASTACTRAAAAA